jgi:hypothetical protein
MQRKTLKRIATEAALSVKVTDAQLRRLSATIETTDHVALDDWNDCIVGQTYGGKANAPKGAIDFGYELDSRLRKHLRLPGEYYRREDGVLYSANASADRTLKVTG